MIPNKQFGDDGHSPVIAIISNSLTMVMMIHHWMNIINHSLVLVIVDHHWITIVSMIIHATAVGPPPSEKKPTSAGITKAIKGIQCKLWARMVCTKESLGIMGDRQLIPMPKPHFYKRSYRHNVYIKNRNKYNTFVLETILHRSASVSKTILRFPTFQHTFLSRTWLEARYCGSLFHVSSRCIDSVSARSMTQSSSDQPFWW